MNNREVIQIILLLGLIFSIMGINYQLKRIADIVDASKKISYRPDGIVHFGLLLILVGVLWKATDLIVNASK